MTTPPEPDRPHQPRPPLHDVPDWHPYTFAGEPAPTQEMLPSWPRLHGPFGQLHGISRLGHVFLSDAAHQQFCVLYPLQGGSKTYAAPSLAEFRRTVVDDPGFQHWIFPESLVRPVVERIGAVAPMDVYYPVPYPMLGGSGEPGTYGSGDAWVFLDIVGQFWMRGD